MYVKVSGAFKESQGRRVKEGALTLWGGQFLCEIGRWQLSLLQRNALLTDLCQIHVRE